jgi:hypothetical protein
VEYERQLRIETEKLRQLLIEIDKKSSDECTANVAAQWSFETNVNEVTQLEAVSRYEMINIFRYTLTLTQQHLLFLVQLRHKKFVENYAVGKCI